VGQGRIVLPHAAPLPPPLARMSSSDDGDQPPSKRSRVDAQEIDLTGTTESSAEEEDSEDEDEGEVMVIDDAVLAQDAGFELRCWHDSLGVTGDAVANVRRLAEEAFVAFEGRSFWVPAEQREPPSETPTGWEPLEAFAASVFAFHTADVSDPIDRSCSGAELWFQVRTGADAGAADVTADEEGDGASINWHFDKDEELLDQCDIYMHPFISTVTYLSDVGAPTVVFGDGRITHEGALLSRRDRFDGEVCKEEQAEPLANAFVSFPRVGKHIAFNGRLLHGCPRTCAPRTAIAESTAQDAAGGSKRVTMLVNVWLNHRPVGLQEISRAEPSVDVATVIAKAPSVTEVVAAKQSEAHGTTPMECSGEEEAEAVKGPQQVAADQQGVGIWSGAPHAIVVPLLVPDADPVPNDTQCAIPAPVLFSLFCPEWPADRPLSGHCLVILLQRGNSGPRRYSSAAGERAGSRRRFIPSGWLGTDGDWPVAASQGLTPRAAVRRSMEPTSPPSTSPLSVCIPLRLSRYLSDPTGCGLASCL
jgi:hypothetical protein